MQERIKVLSREFGNKNERISFIIPAYNEQDRLPKTVLDTLEWCTCRFADFEIIIVDDGSKDETLQLAKLFSKQIKNIRYIAGPHLGKGAAVRKGMLNARGNLLLFMDADGATPIGELQRLLKELKFGADIAVGSRAVQQPGETFVEAILYRKIIGEIFARIVKVFFVPGINDTQCGFKLFRKAAADEIFKRQKLNGFAFDVEILFLARKIGYSVVEVPINWKNQKGSKVNLFTASFRMLFDLLKIKILHISEDNPFTTSDVVKSLKQI